ncbi:MAG: hypothetical protein LBK57_08665 [Clostridiales Family XIII bacterium]|jgi:hypothetical protein|nr:hypothetical protein [Clostridiales Family XIII bacterium]
MKDEHSALIRTVFALALISVLLAYTYFFYSPLRARVMESYREHVSLEKEKAAIAEIMLDPGLISERITDMEGQLLETRPIKGLTPAGVVGDITQGIDRFGLELQRIVLGVPEAPGGGAVADAPQLLSMPVTIYMKAPYDGGMYFMGSLEKSETGTYKIGGFSLESEGMPLSGADAEEGAEGERASENKAYIVFDWIITAYLLYYG